MAVTTTQDLHQRADAAAGTGDFAEALRCSGEALRLAPLDYRARLKVALCLAAHGRTDLAVTTLSTLAGVLQRRGYFLAAIGACRDALGLDPGAKEIEATLDVIHGRIYGVEGRGRSRVPPPSPPAIVPADAADSFLAITDAATLIELAAVIGTSDPDTASTSVLPATSVPLFSDLSRPAFLSLVQRMSYHKVTAGHCVVREGEVGNSLFILVQGDATVTRGEGSERVTMAQLGAGSLFGELALLRSKPRGATVTTVHPSELFEIGREAIEQIAETHPAITEDLVQFARRRLIMNLMATSKIFHPFDDAQRLQILRAFVSRVVEAGAEIITEGKEPSGLYVVLEGEVEVSKVDDGGERVILAYLREGDVFGEIALIEKRLTVATVTATEKSVVLYLDRAKLEAFLEHHPKIREYLATLSGARLEETEQAMSSEGVVLDADDLIIV